MVTFESQSLVGIGKQVGQAGLCIGRCGNKKGKDSLKVYPRSQNVHLLMQGVRRINRIATNCGQGWIVFIKCSRCDSWTCQRAVRSNSAEPHVRTLQGAEGETEATSRTNFIEKHKSGNLLIFFFQRRRAPPTWQTRGRSLSLPTWHRSRISRLVFDCFYLSSSYHRPDQGCSLYSSSSFTFFCPFRYSARKI